MKLPLQLKVMLGFAVALLPLVILTIREFRADVARLERTVLETQVITAGAVAAAVDRQLDTALGLGWAISLDPRVKRFERGAVQAYLEDLVALTPFVTAFGVFDARGESLGFASAGGAHGPGPSIGDRAYFQQVMAANQAAVSNVLPLRTLPGTGIVAAVPIRDEAGGVVGLVTVITDTHALARQHWERSIQAPGQAILLLDRDGRLAFHTGEPDLSPEVAESMRTFPPVVSALAGVPATSASFVSPVAGDERVGAFVRTSTHDWVVGVTVPREVALAPAFEHFRTEFLGFSLILALTVLLSLGFARLLVRPVRELQAAARDLGRGDLSRRVTIHTGDEIEALGASFNEMAEGLEEQKAALLASQAHVHALNAELEARVHERTEALEAANRELEAFSYSVSHDLRAPLRAVDGFVGAALEDYRAAMPPDAVAFLERAQAGARRMRELIDGLLALSRAARAPLTRIRVDLATMAREVGDELAAGTNAEVHVDKVPSGPGDPVLLRQVVTNLLGNALKYSREQPHPRVEFGYADGAWFVRDNGVGFDPATATNLFQPFQRLHDARRFEGSGIGLAIVQRVIARHGGRVWAEAKPGEGATFWFTLGPGGPPTPGVGPVAGGEA